jgi:hypothetical protein
MAWFTRRERSERRLDALTLDVAALQKRVADLEGEDFKLSELRRQARNAVRSLERATANALKPSGGTNGTPAGVPTLSEALARKRFFP